MTACLFPGILNVCLCSLVPTSLTEPLSDFPQNLYLSLGLFPGLYLCLSTGLCEAGGVKKKSHVKLCLTLIGTNRYRTWGRADPNIIYKNTQMRRLRLAVGCIFKDRQRAKVHLMGERLPSCSPVRPKEWVDIIALWFEGKDDFYWTTGDKAGRHWLTFH